MLPALLFASVAAAQLEPGAVVAGTITDQATGKPIRKAEVVLHRVDIRPNQRQGPLNTRTDPEGRYLFADVPSGHYRVLASANGFEPVAYGARSSDQPGRLLLLGPNETRLDTDIALRPTGVITGMVLDEEGDPVRNAQVGLLMTIYERGKPRYIPHMQVTTNDRGQYRIFGIRSGRYRAMAMSQFPGQTGGRSEVSAGNLARPKFFAPQFYPNAQRFEAAEVLHVSAGKEFRGIDFRLKAVPAVRVKGRVVPPPGLDLNVPLEVMFVQDDVPGLHQHNTGMTAQPPGFEFIREDLRPGRYLVMANVRAANRTYRVVQSLELGPGGLENLTLTLAAPVDIKGSVRLEGEGAAKFFVHLLPAGSMPHQGEAPNAAVKDDGAFVIPGVPHGVWDIDVKPIPRGGYLKSMRLGDKDVLTEDLVVTSQTAEALSIVVSTNGASITGEVDIPQSHVGLEAAVLLAPEGKLRNVMSFYTLKGINTEGEFHMEGVYPGSYRLYAFAELNSRAFQDPEFLKPFAEHGVAVEVKEGERITPPKRLPLILPGVIPQE